MMTPYEAAAELGGDMSGMLDADVAAIAADVREAVLNLVPVREAAAAVLPMLVELARAARDCDPDDRAAEAAWAADIAYVSGVLAS